MLFNSIDFLIFFPIVALVYYLVPYKVRYLWLLICSYYFYMCWNAAYAGLILFSTAVTYLSGLLLCKIRDTFTDERKKDQYMKICVFFSFLINLGILAYFKYCNFFVENINAILQTVHMQFQLPGVDVLLPVGISFYTFQALSYTADVYRGECKAEINFFKYALFVSFFPQLVAGPIERSGNLLKQLNEKHDWSFNRARDGLLLMLWGYFLKMVLADRIAVFVNAVYADIETYNGWYLIVASILFAFQIYCDFAGYSTIAMGAAEIMGFRLTDNFNAPYYARSNAEFWQRWHVSLFSWFRDYIYIPLGGNRKGKIRKYINIMVVFLVSGLWHGATWSFVIWGGLNGLYQVVGDVLKPLRDKMVSIFHLNRNSFGHKLFQTIFTFVLVDISWVFFRAGRAWEGLRCLRRMAQANNPWILFDDSLFNLGLDWKNFLVMLVSIVVLMVVDLAKCRGIAIREKLAEQDLWFRWCAMIFGIAVILVFGVWGSGYDATSFIYFQF